MAVLFGLYFLFFPNLQFYHLLLIIPIWSIPSLYFNSYNIPRTDSTVNALRPMLYTISIFLLIHIVFILIGFLPLNNTNLSIYFIISVFLLFTIASLFRYIFVYQYRLRGKNTRQVVLLSQNINAEKIEELNRHALHLGYRFVDSLSTTGMYIQQLQNLIARRKIDLVFLIEQSKLVTDSISAFCDENGLRLKLLLPLSFAAGRTAGLDQIADFLVIDLRHEPLLYLGNRFLKRTMDIIMALLSIILVLTWLPFIVKLFQSFSFPGPLFFVQKRIGRKGKVFNLYKFRTMIHSSESELAKKGQAEKTQESDVRAPWFGRLLRRTNLDEYPQFLNVVLGSMSTVGPRPHMVGEDEMLEKNVNRYRIRRFVKPGITGWAAINGYRGGTDDLDLMGKRTELDIWYLENWTVWLDIKIMIITVWQMITFRIPKAY